MKILKSTFILMLLSNLVISCTADDINEESEQNLIENIQATGGDEDNIDPTEKGEDEDEDDN